jgi:hypothetical protein
VATWQRSAFARVRSDVRSPPDSRQLCRFTEQSRTDPNVAPSRQAGGSLVRAQYRPYKRPANELCCCATRQLCSLDGNTSLIERAATHFVGEMRVVPPRCRLATGSGAGRDVETAYVWVPFIPFAGGCSSGGFAGLKREAAAGRQRQTSRPRPLRTQITSRSRARCRGRSAEASSASAVGSSGGRLRNRLYDSWSASPARRRSGQCRPDRDR